MNIWLVQVGEPLPLQKGVRKQRMALLADELIRKGHSVVRWGSTFDHITKSMLFASDLTIDAGPSLKYKLIKGCGYSRNISLKRYIDHRLIAKKFLKIAEKEPHPDVIVAATPPYHLAAQAVRYSRKHKVPVLVDIRDEWPDNYINSFRPKWRPLMRLLLKREYSCLKYALENTDAITSMIDELKDWGLDMAGRKASWKDRTFHIGAERFTAADPSYVAGKLRNVVDSFKDKTIITFVGLFNNICNPTIVVDVAKRFERDGREDVVFVLGGSGEYYDSVEKAARGLKNTVLTGWLNNEEIKYLLSRAHIGICPITEHRPCFPNKIFMYLSAGLPVVASTPGVFERTAKELGIGAYYRPNDTDGLYSALQNIIRDPELKIGLRTRVKGLFVKYYDSGIIYGELASHVESVVADAGGL